MIGAVSSVETWSHGLCCIYNCPYDSNDPWDCRTCGMRNAVRCAPEPSSGFADVVEYALADEIAAIHVAAREFDKDIRWVWLEALERDVLERAIELYAVRDIAAMEDR